MASCAGSSAVSVTQRDDASHEAEDETAKATWSSSIVLKRTFPLVSQLLQLQKDADLNHAPPDWLSRQSSAGQYFPHSLFSLFQTSSVQSSMVLASHYPDLVGIMDVIADAKNIKKLLKLPFSQSHVTMAVHRVGKTLLLDEYTPISAIEIEKLFAGIVIPQLMTRKKHPTLSHHRNMYSKLLYYSVQGAELPMLLPPDNDNTQQQQRQYGLPPISSSCSSHDTSSDTISPSSSQDTSSDHAVPIISTPLSSEDEEDEGVKKEYRLRDVIPLPPPDPPPQPFHLNVEWNIKDIRMLLGSDLPIFGREGHPAISLRLRDMSKPITVLTGLDYWLDNLMCNVPELAMCFHIDGIVQRYEVIKTEDIPQLDTNCQFSPQEVLEVAQNILVFLKAKCTQEGHTYWLFRRQGEDAIKLYDLTSLDCFKGVDHGQINPFAESVAMLFYRVAQNMLSTTRLSSKDIAIIKLLLENCIKLLQDNHSQLQVMVSSYFLLADLMLSHSPHSSNESSPAQSDGEEEEAVKRDVNVSKEGSSLGSVPVSALKKSQPVIPSDPQPFLPLILGSHQDRARTALEHITRGLESCSQCSPDSWCQAGSARLLMKAAQAYWVLADAGMSVNRLGRSLRYSRLCILCCNAAMVHQCDDTSTQQDKHALTDILMKTWQLCGDIHCLSTKLSESFLSHLEEFRTQNSEDKFISSVTTSLYQLQGNEEPCLQLHTDLETSLQQSIECYKHAQQLHTPGRAGYKANSLNERLANAWNEMGVYYRHVATTLDFASETSQVLSLWQSSQYCLAKAMSLFETVNNVPNIALVYANHASLMVARAEGFASLAANQDEGEKEGVIYQERHCYRQAITYCSKGQEVLHRSSTHPVIWYTLECDLSAACHALGRAIQQRPLNSSSLEESEREVVMLLLKSLQHSESAIKNADKDSARHTTLSQRIGDCHLHLASLYHKTASSYSAQRQKQARTQAEKHYDKALSSYNPQFHQEQLLRVCLEKSLLFEQLSQGRQPGKYLHIALECLLGSRTPLLHCKTSTDNKKQTKTGKGEQEDELTQLLKIVLHRLQAILKQLLALAVRKKESPSIVATHKAMYTYSLKHQSPLTPQSLLEVLTSITELSQKQ